MIAKKHFKVSAVWDRNWSHLISNIDRSYIRLIQLIKIRQLCKIIFCAIWKGIEARGNRPNMMFNYDEKQVKDSYQSTATKPSINPWLIWMHKEVGFKLRKKKRGHQTILSQNSYAEKRWQCPALKIILKQHRLEFAKHQQAMRKFDIFFF